MAAGGKIFGVGLPRTGTTSVSMAMLELGYRTRHVCFNDALYDCGDCFFDTPVYVDYPLLDTRYPHSKFILTWRDPEAWLASFLTNLWPFFASLSAENLGDDMVRQATWHCYSAVFGLPETLTPQRLTLRYQQHRQEVEDYFRHRPNDLLILPMDAPCDHWDMLSRFVNRPRPMGAFPHANQGEVQAWDNLVHSLKQSSWL